MTYRLTPDDLRNAEQAARKFQGTWWQGTSGTLAAWVLLLLKERQVTVDEMNATLRQAVEARYAQQPGGLDLPDSLSDYTLTPAEPVEEATFTDPEPVQRMSAEQLDAAWSGVKARQAELHAKLRDPDSAERLASRIVPAAEVPERPKEAFIGQWAKLRMQEEDDRRRQATDGTTAKFGTGAVRSDTFESFRYDLVSPIGLREVARACAEGAAKYGDWNWEAGMPVHDLLNHALAHIYQFLSGDRGEPHLGHAAWNLLAAIHSHELWPHLNDGTLRGPECNPPKCTKVQ